MDDDRKGYFATGRVSTPGRSADAELIVLTRHDTEAAARRHAVTLVEAGIGAEVADEPEPDVPPSDEASDDVAVDELGPQDPKADGETPDPDASGVPRPPTDARSGPSDDQARADRWVVKVLRLDAVRAAELLEVDPPPLGDGAPTVLAEGEKEKVPVGRIALIVVAALILLPGAAFYLSFRLSGGDCPTGPDVPVSVILSSTC